MDPFLPYFMAPRSFELHIADPYWFLSKIARDTGSCPCTGRDPLGREALLSFCVVYSPSFVLLYSIFLFQYGLVSLEFRVGGRFPCGLDWVNHYHIVQFALILYVSLVKLQRLYMFQTIVEASGPGLGGRFASLSPHSEAQGVSREAGSIQVFPAGASPAPPSWARIPGSVPQSRQQRRLSALPSLDAVGLGTVPTSDDLMEALSYGSPSNTIRVDSTALRYWKRYCSIRGISQYRLPPSGGWTPDQLHYERILVCEYLLFCKREGRGRFSNEILPTTAAGYVYALARWHLRETMVTLDGADLTHPLLKRLIAGVARRHVLSYGPICTHQKAPILPQHLAAMWVLDGGTIAGIPLNWEEPFWIVVRAMVLLTFAGCLRRGEVTVPSGSGFRPTVHLSRGDLSVLDEQNRTHPLPIRQLAAAVVDGGRFPPARLAIKPPPMKNDQFGTKFHEHPIVLPVDDSSSPAYQLLRMELVAPVHHESRGTYPMFPDLRYGVGKPFPPELFTRIIQGLYARVTGEPLSRASTHSLRRGGVCALREAGAPDEIIKGAGRWSSDAFRTYVSLGVDTVLLWSRRMMVAVPHPLEAHSHI